MNRIREAFDSVRADEGLRSATATYIAKEAARRRKKPVFNLRYAMATVALLVGIVGWSGYSAYAMPTSYISIDVNPSLELSLNRFDRVVAVTAYQEDGAAVLAGIELKGKPYADAVDALLADADFQTYLNADAQLTFTVISDRQEEIIAGLAHCRGYARYCAGSRAASSDIRAHAHANGMSFGKYQSYLDLAAYDPTMTPAQCGRMTMKELHEKLAQCGGQNGGDQTHNGCPSGENGNQTGDLPAQNGQTNGTDGAQGGGSSNGSSNGNAQGGSGGNGRGGA